MMMNISVVGMGYVGLSNTVLLAQHNKVKALEVIQEKVDLINKKIAMKTVTFDGFIAIFYC